MTIDQLCKSFNIFLQAIIRRRKCALLAKKRFTNQGVKSNLVFLFPGPGMRDGNGGTSSDLDNAAVGRFYLFLSRKQVNFE